jgi:hypothetical protein
MIIQISSLGNSSMGRFGNQLFQYLFLKIIQAEISCEIRHPPWLGNIIFNTPATELVTPVNIIINLEDIKETDNRLQEQINILKKISKTHHHVEINGFFQNHSMEFEKYKNIISCYFKINKSLDSQIEQSLANLGLSTNQIVCIHIRRGDYINYINNKIFWHVSFDALEKSIRDLLLTGIRNIIFYLCSDDITHCKMEFQKRNIPYITNENIFTNLDENYQLVIDFSMMTKSKFLVISNSSLSFFASLLNHNSFFLRPCPNGDKFIPFDPWNSSVLLSKLSD